MKKFLVKILLFTILLCICDYAMRWVFNLFDLTNRGEIHKMHNVMTNETPEMLIIGSSRASHHYDPKLIGDSLGIDVYNAGFDGRGTILGYGLLSGIAQRKFPKYVLCEVTPSFDIYNENGSAGGIDELYTYSDIPNVKEIITDFDSSEKWKLMSNAYRLNSKLLRIIPSIFSSNQDSLAGYLPGHGTLSPDYKKQTSNTFAVERKIDPTKEKYLRKLIQDVRSNGSEIIFAISPEYEGGEIAEYQAEIDILNECNVLLLNHLNTPPHLIDNREYFSDGVHMNSDGATEYSKIIASELKNFLNNPNKSDSH